MSRKFKYDVGQLLTAVRERPCLWDKTIESYRDRIERRSAWEEIFRILDETYEDMTPEDKRIAGEHILTKWTNIRDTFVKSLKTKMGRPKRKYLLYDDLKFLKKVTQASDDDYTADVSNYDDSASFTRTPSDETVKESPSSSTRKRSKKSTNYDEEYTPIKKPGKSIKSDDCDTNSYNDVGFIECDEMDSSRINDPRIMNEDEAFFASLLPTVVKYSEDERLEFRIEVLAVMKRIKQSRPWSDV